MPPDTNARHRRRPLPFEGMANSAAAWAESPFGKLAAAIFAWAFRAIVLGAIWLGGYAGTAWLDAHTDQRMAANPIIAESAKRIATVEPVVASNARNLERMAQDQRQISAAITDLNSTLRQLQGGVVTVNTNFAVLSVQLSDLKAAQKDSTDRLDHRLDSLSRGKPASP